MAELITPRKQVDLQNSKEIDNNDSSDESEFKDSTEAFGSPQSKEESLTEFATQTETSEDSQQIPKIQKSIQSLTGEKQDNTFLGEESSASSESENIDAIPSSSIHDNLTLIEPSAAPASGTSKADSFKTDDSKPRASKAEKSYAKSSKAKASKTKASKAEGLEAKVSEAQPSDLTPSNSEPVISKPLEAETPEAAPSKPDTSEAEILSGVALKPVPPVPVSPGIAKSENLDAQASAKSQSANSTLEANRKLPPRTYIPVALDTDGPTNFSATTVEASSLLEARESSISINFDAKDASQQRAISTGVESVKKTYRDIRNTIGHLPSELMGSERIDWELWDRVVDNYHDMVLHEQQQLSSAVAGGIPAEFRGIVWQLVAQSKNLQLEELYMHLKTEASVHEKAIKRDLTRTSFFTNVDAANKATELFNVIMAYSNFDPDVGYTQGMVFIAVPLIMNMTESECFCLLVTLMKDYGLRDLFCPEMRGLHLLLHQFDRLLNKNSPRLYNHLYRQGIRSSMYASQWFLTFFSYKFPFRVVLRIFDMVITQGVEAVLRLGLNLILKNEQNLLQLNFDGLLEFLKDSLFNVYVSDEFVAQEPQLNRRFSLLGRKPAAKTSEYYLLDAFIEDSMRVEVSPLGLARWKGEFDQIVSRDSKRAGEIEDLRAKNGLLRHEIKDLESKMYALNHDHLESVQALVNVKVAIPELEGDVSELRNEVSTLEKNIHELEIKLGANHENIPQDIEKQIHELLAQNAQETERFTNLEEELDELCIQNEALEAELKKNKRWFWKK